MKKRFLVLFLFVFVAVSAFVIIKKKGIDASGKVESYKLLPRNSSLAYAAEWTTVMNNARVLEEKVKANPADIKSANTLAALYIQEGRVTGNFTYYNEAALMLVNTVLEKESVNFEALTFKATIFLSQHQFQEAKKIAEEVLKTYPHNAYVYGLLVDANIELGNYEAALAAADKMVSIRPDIRSYSRIAYLREIYGDIDGAIEAMDLAVIAGSPGDENTEWCRVQIGKLFEQIGKMKEAEMQYNIAAENRMYYPYALAGLARIATEEKKYDQALALYMQADSLLPDHTFKEGQAEIYEFMGHNKKAQQIAEKILAYVKNLTSNNKNNNGQNEDHEMAHAYMGVNDLDLALKYALAEYNRRPDNIEVNETAAIVYYKRMEYAKALPHIETALKTNCKKPELLFYAGLIYLKTGDKVKGQQYLDEVVLNNPGLVASIKMETEVVK